MNRREFLTTMVAVPLLTYMPAGRGAVSIPMLSSGNWLETFDQAGDRISVTWDTDWTEQMQREVFQREIVASWKSEHWEYGRKVGWQSGRRGGPAYTAPDTYARQD